jgi:deoxycytidine triphosphate deaminase
LTSGIFSGEDISKFVQKVDEKSPSQSTDQIQPAGYDVTLSRAFSYPENVYELGGENSSLQEISQDGEGYLSFEKGAFLIELNEITSIPKNAIGILLPRSTLLRNGLDIRSALFDPGYSGQPKVMLVCHRPARIKRYSRVGQLILFRSDGEFQKQYAGRYQGEGAASR